MKKDLLVRWIEDLETSPSQTTGKLVDDEGGHCCLGRLCVVAGLEFDEYCIHNNNKPFSESLGLTVNEVEKLTKMNDKGKTFPQIAAWLRKNLLKDQHECSPTNSHWKDNQ